MERMVSRPSPSSGPMSLCVYGLEACDDGIAACLRAQLALGTEDSLLSRKVRRAARALEDAQEIIRDRLGLANLVPPGTGG